MSEQIPMFLQEMLLKQYGKDLTNKILDGYSQNRKTTLRVNRVKTNIDAVKNELQEKIEYFKRCIDALTNELPEDMYIKSSNGVVYYIQRKPTDKELIPYISECECCQEENND